MKTKDLVSLLNRAIGAIETPLDISRGDRKDLLEDLAVTAAELKNRSIVRSTAIRKLINDKNVLGYTVTPNTQFGSAKVGIIRRGDVYVETADGRGELLHVFSTYEVGGSLNGNYIEDPIGAQLATIAYTAISTLEEMKRAREYAARLEAEEAEAKKARRKGKKHD